MITIQDTCSVFNFISRIFYCIEAECLNDPYNRQFERHEITPRDKAIINEWYKNNFNNENDNDQFIDHCFELNFDTGIYRGINNTFEEKKSCKLIVYIVDKELDKESTNIIAVPNIFKDDQKIFYLFIPKNIDKYEKSEKIDFLNLIFFVIFNKGEIEFIDKNELNCVADIAKIFSCLMYKNDNLEDGFNNIADNIIENCLDSSRSFIYISNTKVLSYILDELFYPKYATCRFFKLKNNED